MSSCLQGEPLCFWGQVCLQALPPLASASFLLIDCSVWNTCCNSEGALQACLVLTFLLSKRWLCTPCCPLGTSAQVAGKHLKAACLKRCYLDVKCNWDKYAEIKPHMPLGISTLWIVKGLFFICSMHQFCSGEWEGKGQFIVSFRSAIVRVIQMAWVLRYSQQVCSVNSCLSCSVQITILKSLPQMPYRMEKCVVRWVGLGWVGFLPTLFILLAPTSSLRKVNWPQSWWLFHVFCTKLFTQCSSSGIWRYSSASQAWGSVSLLRYEMTAPSFLNWWTSLIEWGRGGRDWNHFHVFLSFPRGCFFLLPQRHCETLPSVLQHTSSEVWCGTGSLVITMTSVEHMFFPPCSLALPNCSRDQWAVFGVSGHRRTLIFKQMTLSLTSQGGGNGKKKKKAKHTRCASIVTLNKPPLTLTTNKQTQKSLWLLLWEEPVWEFPAVLDCRRTDVDFPLGRSKSQAAARSARWHVCCSGLVGLVFLTVFSPVEFKHKCFVFLCVGS